MNRNKGFTLVELMIVIGLISILTVLGTIGFTNYSQRSRDARRRVDMQQLRAALELFRSNDPRGVYPPSLVVLRTSGFIAAIPQDPLRRDYLYVATPANCTNNAGNLCLNYTLSIALEDGTTYVVTPTSIN